MYRETLEYTDEREVWEDSLKVMIENNKHNGDKTVDFFQNI